MPEWMFPVYAPWPVLASGTGWLAVADGGSPRIRVTGEARTRSIVWEPHSRTIDDEVKKLDLEWFVAAQTRYSDSWRAWWDSLGTEGQRDAAHEQEGRYRWMPHGPELTAMLGHGRCLWISGFGPEDDPTAVGRNWIVVDVVGGELLGVVRVPDPWFRLRSLGRSGVYATYRDEEGASHIVKLGYPKGFESCTR
jgi:hypothetical protein